MALLKTEHVMSAERLWRLMSVLSKTLQLPILVVFLLLIDAPHIYAQDKSRLHENVYMNTSFLDSIHKHQSCFKFSDLNPQFFGFSLSEECAKLNAFTKHEGGIVCNLEFVSQSLDFYSSKDSDFKIHGTILPSDAVILNLKNDTTLYSPYPSIETAIRQQFFCGNFNDSNNQGYSFNPWNGHVIGFGQEFNYYLIVYDFELGIDFDCIALFSSAAGGNWNEGEFYHFKILNSKTLELYKVVVDFEEFNHEISIYPITLTKS